MISLSWRTLFFFLSLVFLLSIPGIGGAQESEAALANGNETLQIGPSEAIDLVAKFILSGRVQEAAAILSQIRGKTGSPVQEQFLEAQIAIRKNNPETALTIYTAILDQNPSQTRVRLERARLLLAMGRVEDANLEFKALRQVSLPANTRAYVDQFLATLRQRQPWSLQMRVAGGYDSNASAGPDQDSVLLFGLPFQLSQTAQEQGAVETRISGAGSYRWTLSDHWDLRVLGGLRHSDYEGGNFDTTLVSAQAGPTFAGRKVTSSLFFTGYRRWFGGDGLSTAWGGQGVVDFSLSDSLRVSALGSVRHVRYDRDKNRSGLVVNTTLRAFKSIGRSTAVVGYGGYSLEEARVLSLENETVRLGVSFVWQLSNDFRFTLTPELARRTFKGVQPAFGRDRKDTRYGAAFEVVGPPITNGGLVPFLTYGFTRNDSNIDFYQYDRHRVNIGVVLTL